MIGGYCVVEKYLKGRKGRKFSLEEFEYVYKVVEIFKWMIEFVRELEKIEFGF